VPPPSWSRTCAYQQPLPPCDFVGLHIEYLGDSALHNKKVRVINVQLHQVKEVLDLSSGTVAAVDEVFALSSQ
jgi:hypothetical protein